jgi:hypothetical protein
MKFETLGSREFNLNPEVLDNGVSQFLATGRVTSMVTGIVMHHICNYCVEHKIEFVLHFVPNEGYIIKRGNHESESGD